MSATSSSSNGLGGMAGIGSRSRRARSLRARHSSWLGWLCLVASLLLLPLGIRTVAAGEPESSAPISIDPALVEAAGTVSPGPATVPSMPGPRTRPPRTAAATDAARQSGVPAVEVAPGVVVLNTRGFNYGPPPTELDPAALDAERFQKR